MTNVLPAAPALLAADWRYAGDDWAGANALTYIVYDTAPVIASDGTVTTPGVPHDLTGCMVAGSLRYMPRQKGSEPAPNTTVGLPAPIGAVIDAAHGVISLSLGRSATIFPRQALGLWGDPSRALIEVRPRVTDTAGNVVTIGLQPLFVF